jgi:fatty-acyl-CoA synthase
VCGTSDRPLVYLTVGDTLEQAVAQFAEREALVVPHQHIRWSYARLLEQVDIVARGFLSLGLEPGERVGIWAPNCAEWVVVQFATARAGLILVNINPAYRSGELQYALQKVGCAALVFAPRHKSSDYAAMVRELIPRSACRPDRRVSCKTLPELRQLIQLGDAPADGALSFGELAQRGLKAAPQTLEAVTGRLNPEQAINIQFTSGTTGHPKGATLTHFNIVNNGFFVGEAMRLTPDDRMCIPVPLYHCFGMVLGVLAAVTHGAAMVFPGESFDALSVLEAVSTERCTVLHGVPTMFIAELAHPRFAEFDLGCLRTGIMAGALCPIAVMQRVASEMHMREVTICYGMTETSPVSFQTTVDDPLDRRVSTVGRVHPHVQVKIVDQDSRVVPRGVAGELLTRGYSVMRGYWADEPRTREAIDADGWMHTGDLATIDEQGYCNIVGRLKDMIIRGGENIYPRELEEFLFGHPDVEDVQVVGIPDPRYGEEVCACIRLREDSVVTEDEIRTYVAARLARYKIPRYVRFVSDFPMTVTGKVQKFRIREQMIAELDLRLQATASTRG